MIAIYWFHQKNIKTVVNPFISEVILQNRRSLSEIVSLCYPTWSWKSDLRTALTINNTQKSHKFVKIHRLSTRKIMKCDMLRGSHFSRLLNLVDYFAAESILGVLGHTFTCATTHILNNIYFCLPHTPLK